MPDECTVRRRDSMLGLIVTGHGHFASGLTSSLELIAGDLQNYRAVDFEASDSVDDLRKKLEKAFDELKECQGILVCSDLAGGSPFKTAVEVGFPRGNVEVVAGSNLPMLIEALGMRGAMSLQEIKEHCMGMIADTCKDIKAEFNLAG